MQQWVSDLARWELFFTGTWSWPASMSSAQRSFERFMKRECPDVGYFYALEQNPSRDGFHVHSLWSNTAGLYRRQVWKTWFDRYGRNKLEPIRDRTEAENYLTKYLTKAVTWWNVHLADQPMLKNLADQPLRKLHQV